MVVDEVNMSTPECVGLWTTHAEDRYQVPSVICAYLNPISAHGVWGAQLLTKLTCLYAIRVVDAHPASLPYVYPANTCQTPLFFFIRRYNPKWVWA